MFCIFFLKLPPVWAWAPPRTWPVISIGICWVSSVAHVVMVSILVWPVPPASHHIVRRVSVVIVRHAIIVVIITILVPIIVRPVIISIVISIIVWPVISSNTNNSH